MIDAEDVDRLTTRRSVVIGGLAAAFGFTVIGCSSGQNAPVVAGPGATSGPAKTTAASETPPDSTTKKSKVTQPRRSDAEQELVDFALGRWNCAFKIGKDSSAFNVEILDGTFILSSDGKPDAEGTWSLDGSELTIDAPAPSGEESYFLVFEDVTLDTQELTMTRYEVNGKDSLKKGGRTVAVERSGENVEIDGKTTCSM